MLLNVLQLCLIYCLNKYFYTVRHSSDLVETTNVETEAETKADF